MKRNYNTPEVEIEKFNFVADVVTISDYIPDPKPEIPGEDFDF